MIFFLGTHKPHWLRLTDVPLFLSARRLRETPTPPRARGWWALDSGAFTEISMHGRFVTSARDYAREAIYWRDRIGQLQFAAPQDWMCEPWILEKTGLSLAEHQRRTVASYLELRTLAPDIPWMPVLQGWTLPDYTACIHRYIDAGVCLVGMPRVGVGSICRRQGTDEVCRLLEHLKGWGLHLHAFGLKLQGLAKCRHLLASSDSMAWSLDARRAPPLPGCPHASCSNCLKWALRWRAKAVPLDPHRTTSVGPDDEGLPDARPLFRYDP